MSTQTAADSTAQSTPCVLVQVGLSAENHRFDFRDALKAWASQSPLVSAVKEDDCSQESEPYWNLHLSVSDIEAVWTGIQPVIQQFDAPNRATRELLARPESTPDALPTTLVVATGEAGWDDYSILYHTDVAHSDR